MRIFLKFGSFFVKNYQKVTTAALRAFPWLKPQQKISKIYLVFRFKNLGNVSIDRSMLTNIAIADKTPNRTVGLKFDNKNTKNPKIIVMPVISIARPVDNTVSL